MVVKELERLSDISWDEMEVGETYITRVRNSETGEWVKKEVTVTEKRENPTLDGSEGARILTVQHKGKKRSG